MNHTDETTLLDEPQDKIPFEAPTLTVVGTLKELTGGNGLGSGDGPSRGLAD